LSQACTQQGVAFDVIASGAGHDAAVFANAGVPSGMVFIRNANGSHNPNEAMDLDDFMPGVAVIAAAAKALA
jgi:N-carbamoyl-L-amino-acid hydrolase